MAGGTTTEGNRIRKMLEGGRPSFGLIATIPSVQTVQTLASAGFDWLLIDQEHGPVDLASTHAMIAATAGTATVPFVRIPWKEPWQAKHALDLGAMGICFPMICSADDASAAVRSVRYPPDGERLWGPFYAPMRWGKSMAQYVQDANADVLCIATIEHPSAIDNIDEIAATPGLDLAFIGPGDLAMSMGVPGRFDDAKLNEAISRAERGLLRSNVALGGVARTAEQARQMIDRGYKAIVLGGFDWMILQQASQRLLEEVHR